MVKEIKGDLLEQYGILCHQTNYLGVMGGGIAAAIKDRLLSDRAYQNYVRFCEKNGKDALGLVEYLYCDQGRIIANCFSQNDFGEPDKDGSITNYDAMRKCFGTVLEFAVKEGLPVFIPYGMGCGIAGGDWGKVRDIIDDVFARSSVTVTIVKLGD